MKMTNEQLAEALRSAVFNKNVSSAKEFVKELLRRIDAGEINQDLIKR